MRKNIWLTLSLLVALAVLLAACAGTNPPTVKYADGCASEEFPLGEFKPLTAKIQVRVDYQFENGVQRWIVRQKENGIETPAYIYTIDSYTNAAGFFPYEENITDIVLTADGVNFGSIHLSDFSLQLICPSYTPPFAGTKES